jgi:hypothetical protein
MPDWLIAWDDLLTQRHRHCTACGGPGSAVTVGVWDLACGASVAYQVCERCKHRHGSEAGLRAKLDQRYSAAVCGPR